MELLNILHNISSPSNFTSIKQLLENDPYHLIIKEDNQFPTLYMLTYDRNQSNLFNEVVKQCRGIILEKETNKIICYTFNKGIDANDSCPSELDWNSTKVELSIDGTQIRLFYYNNQWQYSTTRCIDARKARWFSNKSFYNLFQDVEFQIDYTKLDTNCCYSFVLCHPLNRIVVNYEMPYLVHVLTRDLTTLEELDVNIGVEKPQIYTDFLSYDDVIKESKYGERLEEGFMLSDSKKNRVKIKNVVYDKVKDLRGNTNNLFYRYLQLRYDGLLDTYLSFYPEFSEKFALYELDLHNLAKIIHRYYMNRHVHGVLTLIPVHLRTMIYKLHGNYLVNHENTTTNKIMEELNKLHPSQVCFIYNRTLTPHYPYLSHTTDQNI